VKTVLVSAAIVITLTAPAVAGTGLTAGSEASGEPFNSSFRHRRNRRVATRRVRGRKPPARRASAQTAKAYSRPLPAAWTAATAN